MPRRNKEAETYLAKCYRGALLISVKEVDMRAVNSFRRTLPSGRVVLFRACRDSQYDQDFIEYRIERRS
jgi:hypothetical protein